MENGNNMFDALKGSVVDLVKLCLYAAAKISIESLVIWWLLDYVGVKDVTFTQTLAGLVIVRLAIGSQTRVVEKEKKEKEINVKSTGKQQPHFRN